MATERAANQVVGPQALDAAQTAATMAPTGGPPGGQQVAERNRLQIGALLGPPQPPAPPPGIAHGLAGGTNVRIRATNEPGVIVRENVGVGYVVADATGEAPFAYAALENRVAAPRPAVAHTVFARRGNLPNGWLPPRFPDDEADERLRGKRRLIVQSPLARGDMHDIRAALLMDAQLKVLITYRDFRTAESAAFRRDTDIICAYYEGIPNFAQRVAEIGETAGIRDDLGGTDAAAATRMMQRRKKQHDDADGSGGAYIRQRVLTATAGDEHADDEFDCRRALRERGFTADAPYVLVNFRDSGHNPGGRPPSHPEHDSGSVGYWNLVQCVIAAGYVPVPMGETPGLASWPGPSLAGYFNWPVCQANARRNKRQAEYYLLAALHRFNPNVRALAWRSGVTDAISFVGIPVLALDVAGSDGHTRARGREDLLGRDRYRQVDLSDRTRGAHGADTGVGGWQGALTERDQGGVLGALGDGPDARTFAGLGHQLTAPTLGAPATAVIDVVRQFLVRMNRVAASGVQDQAIAALSGDQRHALARVVPFVQMAAAWDVSLAASQWVQQAGGPGVAARAPATTTTAMTNARAMGPALTQGAQGVVPTAQVGLADVFRQLDTLGQALETAVAAILAPPAPVPAQQQLPQLPDGRGRKRRAEGEPTAGSDDEDPVAQLD